MTGETAALDICACGAPLPPARETGRKPTCCDACKGALVRAQNREAKRNAWVNRVWRTPMRVALGWRHRVMGESVAAIAAGAGVSEAEVLTALDGGPLPRCTFERLRQWLKAPASLFVKPDGYKWGGAA